MAVASISVTNITQTNDQRVQRFYCQLLISAFGDTYPANGIPLRAALAAALLPTTASPPLRILVYSGAGSGYIYQYIPSTGNLQILQVPPSGSLTTAAPLQQIGSGGNSLSGPFEDVILCTAEYLRNA